MYDSNDGRPVKPADIIIPAAHSEIVYAIPRSTTGDHRSGTVVTATATDASGIRQPGTVPTQEGRAAETGRAHVF
jgi:hypothetical protein